MINTLWWEDPRGPHESFPVTCSLWPWRTQVFWGAVLESHMRIPKDGDPGGPGQGAGGVPESSLEWGIL